MFCIEVITSVYHSLFGSFNGSILSPILIIFHVFSSLPELTSNFHPDEWFVLPLKGAWRGSDASTCPLLYHIVPDHIVLATYCMLSNPLRCTIALIVSNKTLAYCTKPYHMAWYYTIFKNGAKL